ncbi:hypothetical protein, partial [Stutzerimonas kunmingensis]|uniref:hypothetical protein n=1 Tax=Stutzerimonas kunmingensis TaxID=1211807 RepID=UPI0028A01F60
AAAVTLCAGVWLVGFTSITIFSFFLSLFLNPLTPLQLGRIRASAVPVLWHGNRLLRQPCILRSISRGTKCRYRLEEHGFVCKSKVGHLLRSRG